MSDYFYIWSAEASRGSDAMIWWRPARAGYTANLNNAGMYTLAEATSICVGTHGEHVPVPIAVARSLATAVVPAELPERKALESAWRKLNRVAAPHPSPAGDAR